MDGFVFIQSIPANDNMITRKKGFSSKNDDAASLLDVDLVGNQPEVMYPRKGYRCTMYISSRVH